MNALQSLIAFAGWTLLLVLVVFLYRGVRFLQGTPINHWPRQAKAKDDPGIIGRLEDAHSNCLENLPIFAVIVLGAALLGRIEAVNPIAQYVVFARIGQTAAHLSGVGRANVLVRATFFTIQLGLFAWMLVLLSQR